MSRIIDLARHWAISHNLSWSHWICEISCMRPTMLRPSDWRTRQFPLHGWSSRSVFSSVQAGDNQLSFTERLLIAWLQI